MRVPGTSVGIFVIWPRFFPTLVRARRCEASQGGKDNNLLALTGRQKFARDPCEYRDVKTRLPRMGNENPAQLQAATYLSLAFSLHVSAFEFFLTFLCVRENNSRSSGASVTACWRVHTEFYQSS